MYKITDSNNDEPVSKTDLKEAISEVSEFISELTRDIAIANANASQAEAHGLTEQKLKYEAEANRLQELKLQYMEQRGNYRKQCSLLRRSKYG